MDQYIELLKEVNVIQILIILSGFWIFYTRLDKKIEQLDEKISGKIEQLSGKIEDVDRRLCRIEGSLQTQGHCLFNQPNIEKKVQ